MKKQTRGDLAIKKHICLDARMYQHSGIGVYLMQLIDELIKTPSIKLTVIVPAPHLEPFKGLKQIVLRAGIYSIKEQLLLPIKVPACDIFWSPHYNVPLLCIRAKKRWVTIHDVFHLRFSHSLGIMQRLYARLLMTAACRYAEKIFTVSNFSKKEILHFFKVENKIEVVHNQVNINKFSRQHSKEEIHEVLKKYNIDTPYILFVGNIKPHKNLITLIKAFEKIINQISSVKLVIVGKAEGFITPDNEIGAYIKNNPSLKNLLFFTGLVEENELPILYSQARIFVFPSLYEGFGYPPLEALAAGTKVICSNIEPIQEVCGDKVKYFNPYDYTELSTLLLSELELD
jgi:glycosyltransferase involved in cell wall biosynthesis